MPAIMLIMSTSLAQSSPKAGRARMAAILTGTMPSGRKNTEVADISQMRSWAAWGQIEVSLGGGFEPKKPVWAGDLRRIGLRARETRQSRHRGSARGQTQECATGKFHASTAQIGAVVC
jgi:hypothetical protein